MDPNKAADQAPSGETKPSDSKTHDAKSERNEPAGGYDATPISRAPPGYTVKFTFHSAHNLPMADINALSSDPFIVAQLNTALIPRHKEDPPLRRRTRTIRKELDPVWEETWTVANVPATGFKLKCRIYDEDPADHDDRLGNAHINVPRLDENWSGIQRHRYKIKKRMGSRRAYFVRFLAVCFGITKHINGELEVSVEVLGRTGEAEGVGENEGGRAFTIGPCWWTKHYSPMLGRLVGQKVEVGSEHDEEKSSSKKGRKTTTYNFQANRFQLQGPVPAELYHRYVEFKPFVKSMFTAKGIRGFILSKTLHHQHARVYNFDRSTMYGTFDHPCEDLTRQFLDAAHYDRGGRIFTYVISLDGTISFTETGKEFGVDMLSKHTLHSNVSVYVAWAGEFFIRRRRRGRLSLQPNPTSGDASDANLDRIDNDQQPSNSPPASPISSPEQSGHKDLSHVDPSAYELVIDNDSGTYRPNAKLLPKLQAFLESNFLGLAVKVLDCQGDEEEMSRLKERQREKKKESQGEKRMVYMQRRSDSFSSSDEDELDALAAAAGGDGGGGTLLKSLKRDVGDRKNARTERMKRKWIRHHDQTGQASANPSAVVGEKQDQPEQG
ncbi:hypothetical protein P152DRAFT_391164 [Eremomyces bilateralis CBS 781.70]|uniref:C2 domain-containing protein n=1 Tax=Eremomyces bilateralis CBS 781.70 TaxID=1392243 RepID=A0A6G1GDP1_9PEZI|nr:uncharacterized protein P152DRAFT_391164 [Eremomyces bilateralis CBS 781.70]KAF1815979.1 hypothetical protein P152DRAFT_391164 [Eremomyces bilateralis CBS 781.70]